MIDISVIIPIYKGSKYLNYLLEILKKNLANYDAKYQRPCEVIFVNDYPEEKLIIQEQKNIRIYNLEENRGIHGARVFGYYKARGNYIVFLDQDDKISQDYLVSQKKNIGIADAVICNGYRERLCIRGKRAIYVQEEQQDYIGNLSESIFEKNCIRSPGQALLKKSAIPKLWLTEMIKANGADDYLLWILMVKDKCIFSINQEHLYTHIEHGENTSNGIETMKNSLKEMTVILEKSCVLSEDELHKLQKNTSTGGNVDFMKLVRVYDYWMYLHIRDKKIGIYLYKQGYKKIAIYGMNYLGNRLYDELCESSVQVIFSIDKAADGIEYEIPIFSIENRLLSEKLEGVDAVIVTAITFYQRISEGLKKISHKPIISMEDILLEMISQCGE